MATYAIGDVQGSFEELRALLGAIAFDRNRDRLWFVGDLVNRGPASLATLRFVRELGEAAQVVLGNHDLHLLAVAHGLAELRDDDTLDEVLSAPDRNELLDWLRHRAMMYVEADYALVHAGLLPQWNVVKASGLAREVEAELRGPGYREFLARLYGSRPDRWSEELRGIDRLRLIVNAMTRMRFCTPDGAMEFQTKGETVHAPSGYLPWFEVPNRKSESHTVIFGHWSALGLRIEPKVLALDTGCVWGGKLSAVRLEDRRLYQVRCKGGAATVRPSPAPAHRVSPR
jgi:bis(5'-nucleosyl)-tetraphosphatase (symmetrical)